MSEAKATDLLDRSIKSVDTYQGKIVALQLDNGAYICLDSQPIEIYRPHTIRRCHECERPIDHLAPQWIVFCDRCGEPY